MKPFLMCVNGGESIQWEGDLQECDHKTRLVQMNLSENITVQKIISTFTVFSPPATGVHNGSVKPKHAGERKQPVCYDAEDKQYTVSTDNNNKIMRLPRLH